METLNEIVNSWDLDSIQEKKEKKKEKTAKDPVFGIAMTWPASDFFGHGHDPEDKEEDDVPADGGMAVEFGDSGSAGSMFSAGSLGTATVGGE